MKLVCAALLVFSSAFGDSGELKEMSQAQIVASLRGANEMAKEVVKFDGFGHQPFGAVLLAPDNETVLLRQGNINVLRHAEMELVRSAAEIYPAEYLAKCTLVANMEPCGMCAGAIYYASIGRVVYGLSRATIDKIIGSSKKNRPLDITSKEVFDSGHKPIVLIGPIPEMEEELLALQKTFWK